MKKILSLTLMTMVELTAKAGVYTFNLPSAPDGTKVNIKWLKSDKLTAIEVKNGVASLNESGFNAQYVKIYTEGTLNDKALWLDPSGNLTVDVNDKGEKLEFSGELAAINKYINNTIFATQRINDRWKDEARYIKSCDSAYKANKAKLKAAQLPAAFNAKETIRLKYLTYSALANYQFFRSYFMKNRQYKPNEQFHKKLKELMTIDGSLMEYPDYGPFISACISCYVGEMEGDWTKNFMAYVDENIKDKKVKGFVVNTYAYNKLNMAGLNGTEELVDYFRKNVVDEYDRSKFDALYARWEAIEPGHPSPKFKCVDINGDTVSLGSLLGKYVYIDTWATWCGPCRAELPHLKRLEEKYHGKDIQFVSISCDKDKTAWKKMVKEKEMKGIQLILGEGDKFMDDYVINGIPRFILLDRAGNIIKGEAPRPSSPETEKLFDELLAKPFSYEEFMTKMSEIEKVERGLIDFIFGKNDHTQEQKDIENKKLVELRADKVLWARRGIEANYNDKHFLDVLNIYLFNFLTVDELSAMLDKFTPEVQQADRWKEMKAYTIYKPLNVVGGKAFDFTYKDHKGKSVTLSKVAKKNKLVVVDFWASWCGPCRASMPHLKEVYEKYKKQGIEVVTVSIDEKADAWEKAYKQLQLPWIDLCNLTGWKDEMMQKYAVRGIPYQALIDSDMNFVAIGFYYEGALEEAIENYLNK